MASDTEIREARLAKVEAFRAAGLSPYPSTAFAAEPIAEALKKPEGQTATVAGRVVLFREMGNITFFHIQDRSGRMQMVLNKRTYVPSNPTADYKFWLKKLDLGDHVTIKGERVKTNTGEPSLAVAEITLISKSLLPLPEKWHGLSDPDQIYRQRYLDLIMNRESLERFIKRSQIISELRAYLNSRGFLEVETPMLQEEAGGAAARPFTTHHNAFDHDFVLRIATELHLKRLLVGGMEKIFEIGKNFRNEGVDRKHLPEYTGFEIYQAYSDFRGMMELFKGMVMHLCNNVFHKTVFKRPDSEGGAAIDFGAPWREARYRDLVCEYIGDAEFFKRTKAEKIAAAQKLGLEVQPSWEEYEIVNEIYGKKIESTLIGPTFVTHLPRELCPLAKLNAEDPSLIDVFECVIAGMEVAPAYSEQNDPIIQRELFLKQIGEETQRFDEDFITALEYGMPSAGGMGVGLDRLVMILCETSSIRDTILFPTLKPQG